MSTTKFAPRIAVYGSEKRGHMQHRGCSLWAAGYDPVIIAAGGAPEPVTATQADSWEELLEGYDGVVFADSEGTLGQYPVSEIRLCEWCRELNLPLLAVDRGMQLLNHAFGGNTHFDILKELPTALQHQHMPEDGDRHAINVLPDTMLAKFYGEGEIIVNSEHRQAVSKIGRGFRMSGQALDGVIETIEADMEGWFAMGVQWHPASPSASGLDIQLFRGFLEACAERRHAMLPVMHLAAA